MTSTMAPYSLPQSVFMLSLGSNALFGKSGSQADLQALLSQFLGTPQAGFASFFYTLNQPSPNYPCLALAPGAKQGDWATVWGPVVYKAKDNPGATNAMYVAHSPSLNLYVVAIAGTNPKGDTALFVEDLDVQPAHMVPWPPIVNTSTTPPSLMFSAPNPTALPDPTKAFIDAGTADGINVLYTMLDTKTGQNLATYLDSVDQTGQTLVFTGHSLGGALSPTLAMLLYPQAAQSATPSNAIEPNLDSQWANVFILATAGPTPGTPGFAALFNAPFALVATNTSATPGLDATFNAWNAIYANSNDVVPLAWNSLSNLVVQPAHPLVDAYPSFFAAGSPLAPAIRGGAGPTTYNLVNDMMTKSGYSGNATPYYVPCLTHVIFSGSWGDYEKHATSYPPAWTASTPYPPVKEIADIDGLVTWVLNAHLGQYSHAFLGYAGPTFEDALTPT